MSQVHRFSAFMWHRPTAIFLERNQQSLGAYWMPGLTYVLAHSSPEFWEARSITTVQVRSPRPWDVPCPTPGHPSAVEVRCEALPF